MLFKRVSRTDPEQVFVVVFNNNLAALNANSTCQWEFNSASVDGVKVKSVVAGNLYGFVGIVDAAMADQTYGLVQIYGYRSTSAVLTTDTSITTGIPLVAVAAATYLQSENSVYTSNANMTRTPIYGVLLESITTSTGNVSRKIFIRAM